MVVGQRSRGVFVLLVAAVFGGVGYTVHAASGSGLLAPTNAARSANGLASLVENTRLDQAASARLASMQSQHYFGHTQPDGTSFGEAATAAGYSWRSIAENLACGYTAPQAIVDAWMASPGHRANMLTSSYREVGFAMGTGDCLGQSGMMISVAIYAVSQSGVAQSTPPATAPVVHSVPAQAASPRPAATKAQAQPSTTTTTTTPQVAFTAGSNTPAGVPPGPVQPYSIIPVPTFAMTAPGHLPSLSLLQLVLSVLTAIALVSHGAVAFILRRK
jgi:hypothetical protein